MNKVKVLFLAANPINTQQLRLDVEIREITDKIRASDGRDSLEIISRWAVRPDDLLQFIFSIAKQVCRDKHLNNQKLEHGAIYQS